MITTREEYLRQASEKEFLTREERLGIRATDSWKESVPMADVQEQALVTLSVEEHLAGLWQFLGLSFED